MDTRIERIRKLLRSDGPRLYALLTRLTLRDDVAEDLMQDLFLRLWDSDGFHKADDATGYAIRTATNLAFEWRRKRNRGREIQADGVEPESKSASPLSILEEQEQYARVLIALDQMSELTRQVVVLTRLEGHSYEAAARRLGKTPHQVRALLSKAVRQLQRSLANARVQKGPQE